MRRLHGNHVRRARNRGAKVRTLRWLALAWLLAFSFGAVAAWYLSGLTVPTHDSAARVSEDYAESITSSRLRQSPEASTSDPTSAAKPIDAFVSDAEGAGELNSLNLTQGPYSLELIYDGPGAIKVEVRALSTGQTRTLFEHDGSWQGRFDFEALADDAYDFIVSTTGHWSMRVKSIAASGN